MTPYPNVSGRIFSKIGEAIGRFGMIAHDDRITVGLSGGKDSVLLLLGLSGLRKRSPVRFSLRASMVDITNGKCDTGPIEDLCGSLGIPFNRITSPVLEVIREREENPPAAFCSKMRAGVLFTEALDNGSQTVAMGHNLDDAVETASSSSSMPEGQILSSQIVEKQYLALAYQTPGFPLQFRDSGRGRTTGY